MYANGAGEDEGIVQATSAKRVGTRSAQAARPIDEARESDAAPLTGSADEGTVPDEPDEPVAAAAYETDEPATVWTAVAAAAFDAVSTYESDIVLPWARRQL